MMHGHLNVKFQCKLNVFILNNRTRLQTHANNSNAFALSFSPDLYSKMLPFDNLLQITQN